MIKKVIKDGNEYLEYKFEDLGMKKQNELRLYDLNGCKICLEPNIKHGTESICRRCVNGRSFDKLYSLGIYTRYESYSNKFGRGKWSNICSKIRCMKPDKPNRKPTCNKEQKKRIGEIVGRLFAWWILDKKIEIEKYKTCIPVPSFYPKNQMNYFGFPFTDSLKIIFKHDVLKRISPSEKDYAIATNSGDLEDEYVILLDDVYKRGETKEKCSKLLKGLGVAKVLVLVLARTVEIGWWGNKHLG